jgi:RNA recognition motif-containing protein
MVSTLKIKHNISFIRFFNVSLLILELAISTPERSQEQGETISADRATLICSKIPTYVKEDDLIEHFATFGDLAELVYTQREGK